MSRGLPAWVWRGALSRAMRDPKLYGRAFEAGPDAICAPGRTNLST